MNHSTMVQIPESPDSLEHRIRAHYSDLPPSERRLADVILEFPGEIASFMASELAASAGVSKAVATRLFKRLGYRDYNAVRLEARRARISGSPVHLNRPPITRSNLSRALNQHIENDIDNLKSTLERLDPAKLSKVIDAIVKAPHVFVIGFRNSYMLGAYIQSELARLRPNVVMLPNTGQTLAEGLGDISRGDLLIVVAFRRQVPAIAAIIDAAKSRSVNILYITEAGHQRLFSKVTWVLQARISGISLFDSYAGAISMMNFLCTAVSDRLKETGRHRLKRIDELHEKLHELME